MTTTYVLSESASGVINSSGTVTVNLGPTRIGQIWKVNLITVQTSSNTSEPTAKVYLNSLGTFIGGTYTGSNDSTDVNLTITNGRLICVWTGGDSGARATLTVYGELVQ